MSPRAASDAVIPGIAAISVGHPGTPAPEGWQWVRLTDVARLESGHTPSRKHPEYWDGDVPWISLPDARKHHGRVIFKTTQHTNEKGLANSAARMLPTDTVCLSRTASVGYVFRLGRPMATSQDFVNWVCTDVLDPQFLMYALLAEGDHLLNFGKGSTHTTIYFPEALAFHLCLPPLAEQRRIVEKVEALLARVDAILRRLESAANALRLARSVTTRFAAKSEGGRETTLAELGQWVSGGTPSRSREDYWSSGEIPWVSPKDMKRDFLSDSQDHLTRVAIESTNTRLLPAGSVLCVVRGMILAHSFPVAMNRVPVAVNQDIRALIPSPGVDGEFIVRAIQARRIELLEKVKESTHGTRRLDSEDLYSLQIILPPESEQRRIARHVAALMTLTDTVEKRITRAIARAGRLRQSILAKAFAGELVPTEAELARTENREYEPASVLLERIANESTPVPKASRPARKRSHRA